MARPKGTPKTGGRKKGSVNTKTKQIAKIISESGVTPLEYMLNVMNNELTDPPALRFEAAKAAAPYCHARLSAVEVTGKDGEELIPKSDPVDLARRIAFTLTQEAVKKEKHHG